MKPIELQTQTDCSLSAQIVRPTVTDNEGTRPCKKEICLLIEPVEGEPTCVNFNFNQTLDLLETLLKLALILRTEEISAN